MVTKVVLAASDTNPKRKREPSLRNKSPRLRFRLLCDKRFITDHRDRRERFG